MIIQGKEIAERVYSSLRDRISSSEVKPRLAIITCAPNFETKKYLALKEKRAHDVGIATTIIELPSTSSTENFIAEIQKAIPFNDGIIVQLPLSESVATSEVLDVIPSSHDVDVLNTHTTEMLSPVVASMREILQYHHIEVRGKSVTVLGNGRLVGKPAHAWFTKEGASVHVVTKDTADIAEYTKNADIVVCGAGVSGLLSPDMIKEGVVILDAGASEDGGELRGDAQASCAEKASLFTPVPGGIGPITIAMLLQNVVDCVEKKLV